MAEELLEQVRDFVEAPIDFEGQKLAEQLTTALLSAFGVIAFLIGYLTQNIYNAFYAGLGGTILTFALIVPPWPFFNTHNPTWLPPKKGRKGMAGISISVDGKKIN